MERTPVSVELELKAYKDSTEEIATLLDSTSQLDSMDVIMQSLPFGWGVMAIEVNQKLASLRTQLGAVMQTQLDELTQSLNVVLGSLFQLQSVHAIKEHTDALRMRFDTVRKNFEESLKTLGSYVWFWIFPVETSKSTSSSSRGKTYTVFSTRSSSWRSFRIASR